MYCMHHFVMYELTSRKNVLKLFSYNNFMLTIATGLHNMQPKQVLLDISTESCNINSY